jgi:hypothetical protein
MLYCRYYFSYNYICFYIYVIDRILDKVLFPQSFLSIRGTCLALVGDLLYSGIRLEGLRKTTKTSVRIDVVQAGWQV